MELHLGTRDRGASQSLGGAAANSALALLIGMMFCLPARAEISDTIHPFVAVSYAYDDNLLRLPENGTGANAPQSDTYKQVQGGLLFERPIGQQLLTGHANFSKVTFDRYVPLDYSGKDFLAALNWHAGKHVEGNLGANYVETLAPYTDFHSDQRNLRVERREYVDGAWRFHPSFSVHAGFTRDQFTYDLASQAFNDRTEDASEFGIDYLESSGSKVGLQLRRVKGSYLNNVTLGTIVIDNGYEQNEAKANIFWNFSGTTQIQFLGGWAQRKHAFFTSRDDSGANYRLLAYWTPVGKVRLTASAWREFGVVESSTVNSSLNKGASLAATWSASAKVSVNGQLKFEKRDFKPVTGFLAPLDSSDLTRGATIGVSYNPLQNLQLGTSLSHDVRSSSAVNVSSSYRSNGISINANAQF